MKKSLGIPLVFASLLLALPGHAPGRAWIPYRKLVDIIKLDKFDALPPTERDKVLPYAKLVPVNKTISPPDAGLVVVDGASRTQTAGGDERYASDARSHPRLELDEDMLKENPLVERSTRPFEVEIDD